MALPPNWTRYTTDEGKEYFHNPVSNKTQWDRPAWPETSPDSLSFQSVSSEVYHPTETDLDLQERNPDIQGRMVAGFGEEAVGGKVPTEAETVSLRAAASGMANSSASSATAGAPSSFPTGNSFAGMLTSAAPGSEDSSSRLDGLAGWAMSSAQELFDVSSDDVLKRLKLAIVPFQGQEAAADDFRARPDFYGPFWVATTAVLFLSATGNFARLLEMDDEDAFTADYSLVSVAATMVYGFLVGVPLAVRLFLYFSGQEADSINFRQVICVYGYSLSSAIPTSIICLVPLGFLRWLATLVGLAVSLAFIRGTLWTDLAIEHPSLKWKMACVFGAAQATIFLVYRIYFFNSVSV
mmetsp:Transcript_4371/g.7742  ORF Transcript_4371/g.7742 Transcript_4371/m.7742 type:complete len:352 (-) Transcript_4371:77-1132(-)